MKSILSRVTLAVLVVLWLLPAVEVLRVLLQLPDGAVRLDAALARPLLNSLVVAYLAAILWTTVAAPAGYALSRRQFGPGRLLFGLLVGLMFIPPVVLMAPIFATTARMGIYDTRVALIAPSSLAALAVVYAAVVARRVPESIIDAARIDGLGEFAIFKDIVVPIIRKPLAALFAIMFIGHWGALAWPLAVIDSPDRYTLMLAQLESNQPVHQTTPALQLTYIAVAALPVIILFLLRARDIMNGAVATLIRMR